MASQKITFSAGYVRNRESYERHRNWLVSTPDVLGVYLEKTYLEKVDSVMGPRAYSERLQMLDCDNEIESLLTVHYADLTREEPAWQGMTSAVAQELLDDIDGKGSTAWDLTKEVIWQLLWAGMAPVETVSTEYVADTEAEARDKRERSYSKLHEPDSLVKWAYFTQDGPYKGALREVVLRAGVSVDEKTGKETQLYKRMWIENPGEKFQAQMLRETSGGAKKSRNVTNSVEVEAFPNPLLGAPVVGGVDYIPLTIFGDPECGPRDTVIFRPVHTAINVLNKQSFYDQACRYLGAPRYIISGSEGGKQEYLTLANNVVTMTDSPNMTVHTLTAADPVASWRSIQQLKQSIRQGILLLNNQPLSAESKESPSVESKQADQEARKNLYNEVIDEVTGGLHRLFGIVHAGFEGTGIAADKVKVVFSRDFRLVTPEEETAEVLLISAMSKRFGDAGYEVEKRVFLNKLASWRIAVFDGEDEEAVRKALIDAVLKQKAEKVVSPLAQLGRGVMPTAADPEDDAQDPAEDDSQEPPPPNPVKRGKKGKA